jgi:hypothetical protein
MRYLPSSAAQDAYDAQRAEETLTDVFNEAEALVGAFVTDLGDSDLGA